MEQNKMKKIVPVIIAIIAVGGISFYGGVKYQQGKTPAVQVFTPGQGQPGGFGARGTRISAGANIPRTGAGMNATSGEVIAKDDKSITVKLSDGGSKIVFFSDKTSVSKTAEGTQNDVVIGEQVMVSGAANTDGSVTASMIQIRPALPPVPSGSSAPSK